MKKIQIKKKEKITMPQIRIVEIAVEVYGNDLNSILNYLAQLKIPFYVEPDMEYESLAEVKGDCEG